MPLPRSTCAALLLLLASTPASPLPTLLYALPQSLDLRNASIARVDPGPAQQVLGATVIDFWRLGASRALLPLAWAPAPYTGAPAAPAPATAGLLPSAPGTPAATFSRGVFGAVLNTSGATPIEPGQTLGTITIEQSWAPSAAPTPWAAGGALDLAAQYQPFSASRAPGAIAVYSSWSLGLRSLVPPQAFLWYETALFDLDRPLGGDEVWHDTVSGSVILHGVLGAPSAFHTAAPDSCAASSATWAGFRRVHFTVSAAQLAQGLAAANARFNLSLSLDPAQWAMVHWNVELEGTAGVAAGHSLHSLAITALGAGA
jgi:hypothetical protein